MARGKGRKPGKEVHQPKSKASSVEPKPKSALEMAYERALTQKYDANKQPNKPIPPQAERPSAGKTIVPPASKPIVPIPSHQPVKNPGTPSSTLPVPASPPKRELQQWKRKSNESIRISVFPTARSATVQTEPPPVAQRTSRGPGTMAQMHGGRPAQDRDLVIGFDFGTSCTKVVIQDTSLNKAYAVRFGPLGSPQNDYLIPAKVYVNPDGRIFLYYHGSECSNLKIDLMNGNEKFFFQESHTGDGVTARHVVAGYFALVLREIRRWFWKTHGEVYRNMNILWQLNIGLPARTHDNRQLSREFRILALAGWNCSVDNGEITLSGLRVGVEEAAKAMERGSQNGSDSSNECYLHPDSVQAVPEVIAEVLGYARSPMRRNGMYLLVDVGASTLDVSTFILHEREGEDVYPILTADVRQLGAYRLHVDRIQSIAKDVESFLSGLMSHDSTDSPIPEIRQYLPQLNDVRKVDEGFMKECSSTIAAVVAHTKRKRNPAAPEWSQNLPVFLCGGGARLPLYRDAARAAAQRLSVMGVRSFETIELPKPRNLEAPGLLNEHYHRLAVAYGLSFSFLDIGKIIPSTDLEDIEKEARELESERLYVSKEMV